MELIPEAVCAAAFCDAVRAAVWAVRGRLLAPGRTGAKLLTVARPRPGDDVEQLGRWLAWIRESGGAMEIVILSDDLSADDRRRARIVTERLGGDLVSSEELIRTMGDRLWQKKETRS